MAGIRLSEASDGRVLVPGVTEAGGPTIGVARGSQPPVDGPAGAVGVVVAADVVAEQVVGEQYVSSPAVDLGGPGQLNVGITARGGERVRAALGEEDGVREVGTGPDPQVVTVVDELVGEQQPRQQSEGARGALAACVAVEVRPAGRCG